MEMFWVVMDNGYAHVRNQNIVIRKQHFGSLPAIYSDDVLPTNEPHDVSIKADLSWHVKAP